MPHYAYVAFAPDGASVAGHLQADSEGAVLDRSRRRDSVIATTEKSRIGMNRCWVNGSRPTPSGGGGRPGPTSELSA